MAEKNKRNQYLLLALVALIWGGVIYRFWSFTTPEKDTIAPIKLAEGIKKTDSEKVGYQFHLDYSDPFMRNQAVKVVEELRRQVSFTFPPPLPALIYLGLVTSGNQKVGVLKVNGKNLMVKEGESRENLDIKKLGESQAVVRLQLDQLDTLLLVEKSKPN